MLYLLNSFSLHMIKDLISKHDYFALDFRPITMRDALFGIATEIYNNVPVVSLIDNGDKAKIIGKFLNDALDDVIGSDDVGVKKLAKLINIYENESKLRQLFGSLYSECHNVALKDYDSFVIFCCQSNAQGVVLIQPYSVKMNESRIVFY